MDEISEQQESVELLQQLGLKEYEARSFVALSRLGSGTAKDISEVSDVPRTRVYDAVRVLESKGLVEIQHSSPQQFRPVSIEAATTTLLDEYESRTERLESILGELAETPLPTEHEVVHEVWSLSGTSALTARTGELLEEADNEVVLVVGNPSVFSADLAADLRAARDRGLSVIVGTVSPDLRATVEDEVADIEVFESGLEWLASDDMMEATEIGRLLLVDRTTLLVSTVTTDGTDEYGIFSRGLENGIVAIVRRMLATGFLPNASAGVTSDGDSPE